MLRKAFVAVLTVFAFALVAAAPASATTFCVPGYFAACPNSGGNVAQASLEFAMMANGEDGIPDKVMITNYTYVDPDILDADGTDPLEIVGSGTDKTVITSSTTQNDYVMRSGFGERELTIRDLTIRVPASIASGGSGLFLEEGHLENVNIETRHPSTTDALVVTGAVTYDGGLISGVAGGTFLEGVTTAGLEPGTFELEGVTIDGADRGLTASAPDQPVTFAGGRIRGGTNSVFLYQGARADFRNSIIEGGSNATFVVQSGVSVVTKLDIESSTVIAGDPAKPAISGAVLNAANHDSVRVNVRNSIFRGFNTTFALSAPANLGAIGNAYISFTNSNFNLFGTRTGDGSTYIAPSNINQDPLFSASGDYSLTKGSPSIDAGDPLATEPAKDILGRTRPIDGDVDGTAIRDQGAYEFVPDLKQAPPTCATDPKLCPDKTAPKITKVKFKAPKGKKQGSLELTLSEAAKISATFKPTPVGKGKAKRKTLKLSKKGKVGVNKLAIKKKKLKPGKYKLTITATDAAGNKSEPVVRTLKVKPAGCSIREKRC